MRHFKSKKYSSINIIKRLLGENSIQKLPELERREVGIFGTRTIKAQNVRSLSVLLVDPAHLKNGKISNTKGKTGCYVHTFSSCLFFLLSNRNLANTPTNPPANKPMNCP